MTKLKWKDEYNIGIPKIDEQHQSLVKICNALLHTLQEGGNPTALKNVMRRLREYTVHHFHEEEQFMESIRMPDRGKHCEKHLQLKGMVKEFQHRLFVKDPIPSKEVLDFLRDWLINHILDMDRQIVLFMQTQQAETSGAEPTDG